MSCCSLRNQSIVFKLSLKLKTPPVKGEILKEGYYSAKFSRFARNDMQLCGASRRKIGWQSRPIFLLYHTI